MSTKSAKETPSRRSQRIADKTAVRRTDKSADSHDRRAVSHDRTRPLPTEEKSSDSGESSQTVQQPEKTTQLLVEERPPSRATSISSRRSSRSASTMIARRQLEAEMQAADERARLKTAAAAAKAKAAKAAAAADAAKAAAAADAAKAAAAADAAEAAAAADAAEDALEKKLALQKLYIEAEVEGEFDDDDDYTSSNAGSVIVPQIRGTTSRSSERRTTTWIKTHQEATHLTEPAASTQNPENNIGVPCKSVNVQSEVFPPMMHLYQARANLLKDLPKFAGDSREWPIFAALFDQGTSTCGFTDADNLVRLQQSLQGTAREAVRAMLLDPRNVPDIRRTLERRFGRTGSRIDELMSEARRAQAITSKPDDVIQAVKDAIDIGYRHIDCAHVYENENQVGEAIRSKITEGVVSREDLFVTSKLWNTFHRPSIVEDTFQMALKDLGLEYLDLYLLHWPMGYKEGNTLYPSENGKTLFSDVDYLDTWMAMEELIDSGLVKSIGISNFNRRQVERILAEGTVKPVVNQVECHPYLSQQKLSRFLKTNDIVLTAYSPLGSPDRPRAKPGEARLMDNPKIGEIAKKYEKSPAQILVRYQVDRGHSLVPKSVTKQWIAQNYDVFDFKLATEDVQLINDLDCNGRLVPILSGLGHKYHPFQNDEY